VLAGAAATGGAGAAAGGGAATRGGAAGKDALELKGGEQTGLDEGVADLPSYLSFPSHAKARSLLNTPPMFSVYVTGKMLRWIEDRGGLQGMAERAERRSGRIYDVIEASGGFYTLPAEPQARSRTNVVFRMAEPNLDARFLAETRAAGLVNLKGHRSVGGMRASIYNAMPDEGVDELAGFMRDFAEAAG